jgi:peptidoglycan/LPS O-acetylase OafA/YrhL
LQIDDNAKIGAPRGRIPSLDGLRAVSIILVMASHAIQGTHSFLFRLFFLHADLGVRVFFIISGFLITSLLLQERAEAGRISLLLFYIRRTLRILPPFVLFVVAVATLNALGIIQVPPGNWVYALTYTMNFDTHAPWVLGHLWSLSVEEQFYLLWPLVMRFARPSVWTGVATVSVFAGIASAHLIDPALHYAFPFVCGPIAMGCLLAIQAPAIKRLIAASKFLSSDWFFLFAVPVIALLDTPDFGNAGRYIALVTNSLVTLCVARLVFMPVGMVAQVLNRAPLVRLGKLSYSLYLFQQLFLDSMSAAPILIPFPFNLAAALTAGICCYALVEVPMQSLRGRFRKPSGGGERVQRAGMARFVR